MMTIIQNSYGDANVMAEVSAPAWKAYSVRHGYSYVLSNDPPPRPELRPPWSKMPGIIRALIAAKPNDTLLYADVDSVPLKDDPLDAVLNPGSQMGLVRAKESVIIPSSTRQWWNAGVMFIRATPKTLALFQAVLAAGDVPGQEWTGEQARLNAELDKGNVLVQALDNQYNTYTLAPSKTPFIRAFHGETQNTNAARLMKLALAGKLRF